MGLSSGRTVTIGGIGGSSSSAFALSALVRDVRIVASATDPPQVAAAAAEEETSASSKRRRCGPIGTMSAWSWPLNGSLTDSCASSSLVLGTASPPPPYGSPGSPWVLAGFNKKREKKSATTFENGGEPLQADGDSLGESMIADLTADAEVTTRVGAGMAEANAPTDVVSAAVEVVVNAAAAVEIAPQRSEMNQSPAEPNFRLIEIFRSEPPPSSSLPPLIVTYYSASETWDPYWQLYHNWLTTVLLRNVRRHRQANTKTLFLFLCPSGK